MQNWEDVGIKTELATGQLVEFNTYNEMKENDDEALETFFGAWSVGTDPDPSYLWSSKAEFNFGRWVNEESDALLEDGLVRLHLMMIIVKMYTSNGRNYSMRNCRDFLYGKT